MPKDIEEATRLQVALFLPVILQKALKSYYEFMEQEIGVKTNIFSDHHKAGKVALAHIDLLLKLSRLVKLDDLQDKDGEIANILANATYVVKEHQQLYHDIENELV